MYVDLRPDRVVTVWLQDEREPDRWHQAEVRAWRTTVDETWQAWVSWYTGPGAGYIAWVPEQRIRRGAWVGA